MPVRHPHGSSRRPPARTPDLAPHLVAQLARRPPVCLPPTTPEPTPYHPLAARPSLRSVKPRTHTLLNPTFARSGPASERSLYHFFRFPICSSRLPSTLVGVDSARLLPSTATATIAAVTAQRRRHKTIRARYNIRFHLLSLRFASARRNCTIHSIASHSPILLLTNFPHSSQYSRRRRGGDRSLMVSVCGAVGRSMLRGV